MERTLLRDGTSIEAEVNGKSCDGTSGSVLLVPSGRMSLAERLAERVTIDVKRDEQGTWKEVVNA